jgi:hypothetical protein
MQRRNLGAADHSISSTHSARHAGASGGGPKYPFSR